MDTALMPFWHGPFWEEGVGDDETGIGGQRSGIIEQGSGIGVRAFAR